MCRWDYPLSTSWVRWEKRNVIHLASLENQHAGSKLHNETWQFSRFPPDLPRGRNRSCSGEEGGCRPQGLPGLSEGGILPSLLVIGPQGWLSPSGGWCSSRGVLRVPKQSDSVCLVVHPYCYSNRLAPGTTGSWQNDQDSLKGLLVRVWPGCRPGEQTWKPGIRNIQDRNSTPNSQKLRESENEYKLNPTGTQGSNRRSTIPSPRLRDIPMMNLRGEGAGNDNQKKSQSKKGWVCVTPRHGLQAAGHGDWAALIFRDAGRTVAVPSPGQSWMACLPDSADCTPLLWVNGDWSWWR